MRRTFRKHFSDFNFLPQQEPERFRRGTELHFEKAKKKMVSITWGWVSYNQPDLQTF